MDNHTRESLTLHPAPRIRGIHVAEVLERVAAEHGLPEAIQVDNGPEFISKDLDLWAYWNRVKLDFSRPGKPTDNATIESFNARFRQECLNTLVPEPVRCPGEDRGLADGLQPRPAAQQPG